MNDFANSRIAAVIENLRALSPDKVDSLEQPPLEVAALVMISVKLDIATNLMQANVPHAQINDIMRRVNEGFLFIDPRFTVPENQTVYAKCADIFRRDMVDTLGGRAGL